jgi:hypothetical protein
VFRISRKGRDEIVDVERVEEIEAANRSSAPGRYHVDEISVKPLPSGHTARRWGIAIERQDGPVVIEPDPWDA